MSKTLSLATIEVMSQMSKWVDRGLTPKEAALKMKTQLEWRCSKGYPASQGAITQARKRIERRLEMEEAIKSGVTTFYNCKPIK